MRNDTDLGPSAVANFVRGELARSLRSRHPYTVNLLLGGMDPITKQPHLYWLDYLASLAPLPYAAHGYAQYVTMAPFQASRSHTRPSYTSPILTPNVDITASQFSTSTIIQTSISNKGSKSCECAQTSSSEGYP